MWSYTLRNRAFLLLLLHILIPVCRGGYDTPNCESGRTVIVHLFNWKWEDVAAECERFLGPKGFCGAQVSPPSEHRVNVHPNNPRPWWERYQTVSYKLDTRSGTEAQFKDMVNRCNAVHVKIYADIVFNHMTATDEGESTGSGGSVYNGRELKFPAVPYGPLDFNCCYCHMCSTSNCGIQSYHDIIQVRNCRLVGLADLALGNEYVRVKVAEYMNHLLDIGVAGFRVDACKHMWPGDMEAIYGRLKSTPFMFSEVIDMGGETIKASEYMHLGRVTEFKHSAELGQTFRRYSALKYLRNFGEGWSMMPSNKALVFVDNHDNQRGHGPGGANILTFWEPRMYKMATAFTLAWPYGFVRVMSSYRWQGGRFENDWMGPPHNDDWSIKSVIVNDDDTCGNDWVCEHRWRQITNMVKFRNLADGEAVESWWDNSNNQIAFSRGNKAFIAFNNEEWNNMDVPLYTGLAEGTYCDIISGSPTTHGCSGGTVVVNGQGYAQITISVTAEDPMVAIHTDAKAGSG